MTDTESTPDLREISRRFDEQRCLEEAVFRPSSCIHETILKLQCAWSTLLEEVKHLRYHDLGREGAAQQKWPNDAPITKGHELRKYLAKLAKRWNVDSWFKEADEWFGAAADRVGELRNCLAHMLYIESITGERPNREIKFVMVPLTKSLSFRDDVWSQQLRERKTATEQELREALAECEQLLHATRILDREISIAREDASGAE
ncbi:hypothetical protein [Rhodococcus aetherivorans]|uniref:hypothetical protein n=1 Tax=Rhodococcus aetherivorans TaxID=191292 RepID=UPI00241E74D6|nr:hypothetical protein [Rhodococcus aetherivorans]WFS11863.1 hypothetical protein P9K37_18890 [Rhodococcus aetherivorans]